MKKVLLLFLLLPLMVSAQKNKQSDTSFPSPFEFSVVDSLPGTKAELFVRAKEWFVNTYNANAVIQMSDKDAGKIIGKAKIQIPIKSLDGSAVGYDHVEYTITVDVRDGKYRCVISGFYHTGDVTGYSAGTLDQEKAPYPGIKFPKKRWEDIRRRSYSTATVLIASFKDAMHKDNEFK